MRRLAASLVLAGILFGSMAGTARALLLTAFEAITFNGHMSDADADCAAPDASGAILKSQTSPALSLVEQSEEPRHVTRTKRFERSG